MGAVTLNIDIPVFNFDLIQGQDLSIPITYVTTGVTDTLAGGALKMLVYSTDFSTVMDTLSTANQRINITGVNAFTIIFPSVKSNTYKLTGNTLKLPYKLELTVGTTVTRIFEGTINVRRI